MDNNPQVTPAIHSDHKVVSDTKIVLLALLMFVFGSVFSQMFTLDSLVSLKGSSIESQSSYTLEGVNTETKETALIGGMKTILLPSVTFDEVQSNISQARVSKNNEVSQNGSSQGPVVDLYYNCKYVDGTSQTNVWFDADLPMIVVVNSSNVVIGTCTPAA